MIRLIAMDLDDTLIAPDQHVPQENFTAIREAQDAGMHVVFATARGWHRTEALYRESGLDTPAIVSSGARLIDGVTGDEMWVRTIPTDLVRDVIRFSNEHEISLRVYVGAREYNNLPEDPVSFTGATYVPELQDHLGGLPFQIFTKGQHETDLLLERFGTQGEGFLARRVVYADGIPEVMFLHPQSTKGMALATLCRDLGITKDEVMAIGDSMNDLSMIEWAGIGVAMSWAPPAVRAGADFVTSEGDPAGVAEAIRHALDTIPGVLENKTIRK
jgi:5-amino-6-(5-phospho-D-ribitylamino)uracil phosphatase